jgi:hypothetical protein
MVSAEQLRKIALSMPDAEESSHFGHPDFRVRGKIFATLWPDGKTSVLKLAPERREIIIAASPDTFSIAKAKGGWTKVDLRKVGAKELRTLIRESWELVAPKKRPRSSGAQRSRPPRR